MDQAQNTFSALQTLAFQAKFTVRWLVLGADPDQASNSPNIDPAHRAVNGNALDLGCIAFWFGSISGGGLKTAMTASIGKCWPFSVSEGERA